MSAALPWIVVGNPENRRVTAFAEALRAAGQALRGVVSWRQVLADPGALLAWPDEPTLLRIESAGEDDEVHHALLVRGGGDPATRIAFGQLVAPRAVHQGFLSVLEDLREVLSARPSWVPLAGIDPIARVFDKSRFHAHAIRLGVRVSPCLPGVDSYDALVAAIEAREGELSGGRVFVKLRWGSSAVGIGVYRHRPAPSLITTVLVTPDGWFNTMRLARLSDVGRIRSLVDGLCAEGVHVEAEVPKATLGDATFDLRVVAIAGEPAFTVVRCNRHPITNLHLGGWRGDLDEVRARCPEAVWEAAMDDVRTVARDHGGLHLGCDVLIDRPWAGHRVIEANAFGDLLPGLVDAAGRSVYAAEIDAVPRWTGSR